MVSQLPKAPMSFSLLVLSNLASSIFTTAIVVLSWGAYHGLDMNARIFHGLGVSVRNNHRLLQQASCCFCRGADIVWTQKGKDIADATHVQLSASGDSLAVANINSVRFYDYQTATDEWIMTSSLENYCVSVACDGIQKMHMTPDGQYLGLALTNGFSFYPSYVVFDTATGTPVAQEEIGGTAPDIGSPNYRFVHAVLSDDGKVVAVPNGIGTTVFELSGGSWIIRDDTLSGFRDPGTGLDFRGNLISMSSDGSKIVVYHLMGGLQIVSYEWDGSVYQDRTGSALVFETVGMTEPIGITSPRPIPYSTASVLLAADGNRMAVSAWYEDSDEIWWYVVRFFVFASGDWAQLGSDQIGMGDPGIRSRWSERECFSSNGFVYGIYVNAQSNSIVDGPFVVYSWDWGEADWVKSDIVKTDVGISPARYGDVCSMSENGRAIALLPGQTGFQPQSIFPVRIFEA